MAKLGGNVISNFVSSIIFFFNVVLLNPLQNRKGLIKSFLDLTSSNILI